MSLTAELVLALAAAGAMAIEREPDVLTLTSKWVARHDQDACHLLGQFGSGEDSVVALFTRYQPGDSFDFALIGKRMRHSRPTVDAQVDFGIRADKEQEVMLGKSGQVPGIFFKSIRLDGWERDTPEQEPPKITPEQEASVTGVTVSIRGERPLRLATGRMGKPMAAMRTCMSGLLKSWGYDPVVQETLQKPVKPTSPPHRWLRSSDYPLAALSKGHNGLVQFRLDIDRDGKIAGCHVLARTSPDDFADTTCRTIAKRARFEPALDSSGKPVRSYYISSARFMMGS